MNLLVLTHLIDDRQWSAEIDHVPAVWRAA
jgi:hypothetical protein